MRVCDRIHEEIVHEQRDCPFCIAMAHISDLEEKIKELEKELDIALEEKP